MFGGDTSRQQEPELISLKRNVEQAWQYSSSNFKRYQEFLAMTFRSALSDQDRETLRYMGRPPIESMLILAHISRIQGEFAKQQFNINVHPAEGVALTRLSETYIRDLEILQAHLNELFLETSNGKFQWNLFQDVLAGGFGVAKLYVDFINERSFLQKIFIERMSNPCLCGFDPLAKEMHKGDGRFAFQIYPMTQEEFKLAYGADLAKEISYTRNIQSFNWSYTNAREKIVLVCEFFEKEMKNSNLLLLSDETTMLEAKYNKMLADWNKFEVPPTVIKKRKVQTTEIKRKQFCETTVLNTEDTYYNMLPLVYFAGRSVMLADNLGGTGGQNKEFTIPYGYPAKDAQRLKNVAMQTLGYELEGMMQHKIMIPKSAVPKDPKYVEAYTNPQKESVLVWEQFDPDRPDVKNEPPIILQRPGVPTIIMETYQAMDQTIQACFGTYDAILGINGKEISGKAIQQGALQSDASVMPYLEGFQAGLERCAEIIVNLIPDVYVTARSIPIHLPDGKREHVIIKEKAEDGDAILFNYDPHELAVKIETGVNSNVQKQLAIESLTLLMNTSETFKAFMETKGLPVLLKNIEIRGIEGLEAEVEQFMQEMQEKQAQAANAPTDTDKLVGAEIMKSQLEAQARDQKTQADLAADIAKTAVEKERVENERMETEIKAAEIGLRLNMERENQAAQSASDTINLAVGVMQHQMEQDALEKAQQQPQGTPNE